MRQRAVSNEIPPLPQGFLEQLAPLLKEEAQAFLRAYDAPFCRGLRENPKKIPEGGLAAWLPGLAKQVAWEPKGRYIPLDSPAGLHPLHEAGAYYLQEPSAMAPVAALHPKPGDWVLDLCAAPGGKSTQIAACLAGSGLLVSNEPSPERAKALSGNLERMGVGNALVTCEMPERLKERWACLFDRVLVDAPCSGEGMFRRHPQARLEWTAQSPIGCARRQADILSSAAAMVKSGGYLCYSTCTFNDIENEGVVEGFLRSHPEFHGHPFCLAPDLQAPSGMLRLWPHRVAGEGHFVALMKKSGEPEAKPGPSAPDLPAPDRAALNAYGRFLHEMLGGDGPQATGLFAGRLVCAPALPPVKGLRVLRAGLHLGQLKGQTFVPDHALALWDGLPSACPSLSLVYAQAQAYLRGEALPMPEASPGWVAARLGGLALGWGKIADGRLQNHYPKGLRKG